MFARQRAGRSEGQAKPGPGDQILSPRPYRRQVLSSES